MIGKVEWILTRNLSKYFFHLDMLEILRFLDLEQEACDQEQKESQESITSFLHEHMCVFSCATTLRYNRFQFFIHTGRLNKF